MYFRNLLVHLFLSSAVHETSKRLSQTLRDVYESDWNGVGDLAVITEVSSWPHSVSFSPNESLCDFKKSSKFAHIWQPAQTKQQPYDLSKLFFLQPHLVKLGRQLHSSHLMSECHPFSKEHAWVVSSRLECNMINLCPLGRNRQKPWTGFSCDKNRKWVEAYKQWQLQPGHFYQNWSIFPS